MKPNPLAKYRYLSTVQTENETLFHRVMLDHLEEMLPIVYTPTVGQACIDWSRTTSRAECTAEQAYKWTNGRVVFASGSPFDPVTLDGTVHTPAQGNNSSIFPGVGLGLLLSGARRVTDEMFIAAADALAGQVSESDLREGRIFPVAGRMREAALAVSVAVAVVAYNQGHTTRPRPVDLAAEATRFMYVPQSS